ncbi:MAG: hypothetical protein ACKVRN_14145 [Pyrinomonadaceae bacterium]
MLSGLFPMLLLLILFCGLVSIAVASPRNSGRIAFASNRDGNTEIYSMRSDGTNQIRLTNNTGVDYHPVWSPDGTSIAYLSQNGFGPFSIKVMNADGSNQTVVTSVFYGVCVWPWRDDWSMSWSPNGKKIAFQENGDIFTVDIDGTNRINLTNHFASDAEPTWSADGTRIIFTSSRLFFSTMYSMNANGTNVQALPSDGEFWDTAPMYSPTGDRIAFVVNSNVNGPILYTANADGTNRLPFDGLGSVSQYRNNPRWSPNGTRIVFHLWEGFDDNAEIYVKNVSGGQMVQLTNSAGSNFHPSWQQVATKTITVVSGD